MSEEKTEQIEQCEPLNPAEVEKAEKKLRKARIQLIQRSTFFGTLALHLKLKPTMEIETSAVNMKDEMLFNPRWINKRSFDEAIFVCAHEVMHLALDVFGRCRGRNPQLWNVAHDFAINLLLVESGFQMPDECLYNKEYEDMTAEAIYEIVKEQAKSKGGEGDKDGNQLGFGQSGGCCDHTNNKEMSPAQKKHYTEKWQRKMASAAHSARQKGDLPAGIQRLVDELLNPQIPWKEVLKQYLRDLILRSDYSYRRPGRRSETLGYYTPSMPPDHGVPVLFVDTSGSMGTDELTVVLSEVREIIDECRASVRVVSGDTEVTMDIETDSIDDVQSQIAGGGGTDFGEFFERMHEEPPSGVIFFSDLCGSGFPSEPPQYPILWVVGDYHSDPPFLPENLLQVKVNDK